MLAAITPRGLGAGMRIRPYLLYLFCAFSLSFARPIAMAQSCSPGTTDPSVTICLPQNASAVGSPIHLQIATNDSVQVDVLQIYYNQVKRWEKHVSNADLFLAAAGGGPYRITAVAHDISGRWFQSSVTVNLNQLTFVCTLEQLINQTSRSVEICQPTDGELHFSPVHLAWFAQPASGQSVQAVQIFVDGVSMFRTPPAVTPFGGFQLLQTYLPMSLGRHRISIQGYDSTGAFKSTIYINVPKIYQGCAPPSVMPAVNICSLVDGQTVTGIINLQATAAASSGIKQMKLYLDNNLQLTTPHAWMDNGITAAPGPHIITVKAVSNSGAHFQRTVAVTLQ
jgi:hypothetical protein